MPLVTGGSTPKIVLDAYVDNSDFNKKIAEMNQRVDSLANGKKRLADQTQTATKRMSMSWTDFRSMYSTVLDVVRVGVAVWEEVGQKYVDNAVQIGNMARSLGTTTEEASRLKEVADDVGISVQSLTTSFKLAQKDGFQPSIEGLARMSDEYLALQPGVERTQYLLDRFGKSGEEMGKLLDKGSEAIIRNAAAIDKNLIVTQKAYEEARKYQVSVDALKDSWDGLTYKAAPPLVDALNSIINKERDYIRAREMAKEQGIGYIASITTQRDELLNAAAAEREAADATLIAADASKEASGAFESESEMASRLADEAKQAAEAIAETTKSNQDMLGLIGSLQGALDSYNGKMGDLNLKVAEQQANVDSLIAQGWSPYSEKVVEAREKLDEAKAAIVELDEQHAKTMAKMAVDLFITKLSVDGLTDAEYNAALQAQLSAGLIDQATIDMAIGWNNTAQAAANAVQPINNIASAIYAIPSYKSFTFDTFQNTYYNQFQGQQYAGTQHGRAAGGPISAGVPYMVGERGPEMIVPQSSGNVIPNNKLGKNDNSDIIAALKKLPSQLAQAMAQRG